MSYSGHHKKSFVPLLIDRHVSRKCVCVEVNPLLLGLNILVFCRMAYPSDYYGYCSTAILECPSSRLKASCLKNTAHLKTPHR